MGVVSGFLISHVDGLRVPRRVQYIIQLGTLGVTHECKDQGLTIYEPLIPTPLSL